MLLRDLKQRCLFILFRFLFLVFSLIDLNCHGNEMAVPLPQKKYTLSISSVFKDEAPWLKEWIEYHLLIGVEHFYLYNNISKDTYMEVLNPYIKRGVVTIIDWPDRIGNGNWVFTTQGPGFIDSCRRASPETTWLAMIDIDEFLLPVTASSMPEFLSRYNEYPGILAHWHVFGTSYIRSLLPDTLLIEVLHKTELPNAPDQLKSIVKPEMVSGFEWPPHKCTYIYFKKPIDLPRTEIRINHYVSRTENFLEEKIAKKEHMECRKVTAKERLEIMSRGNDIEDKEKLIQKYVPKLRKQMGFTKKN